MAGNPHTQFSDLRSFDASGYDGMGYDPDGYDRFGYDADGYDIQGRNRYHADIPVGGGFRAASASPSSLAANARRRHRASDEGGEEVEPFRDEAIDRRLTGGSPGLGGNPRIDQRSMREVGSALGLEPDRERILDLSGANSSAGLNRRLGHEPVALDTPSSERVHDLRSAAGRLEVGDRAPYQLAEAGQPQTDLQRLAVSRYQEWSDDPDRPRGPQSSDEPHRSLGTEPGRERLPGMDDYQSPRLQSGSYPSTFVSDADRYLDAAAPHSPSDALADYWYALDSAAPSEAPPPAAAVHAPPQNAAALHAPPLRAQEPHALPPDVSKSGRLESPQALLRLASTPGRPRFLKRLWVRAVVKVIKVIKRLRLHGS